MTGLNVLRIGFYFHCFVCCTPQICSIHWGYFGVCTVFFTSKCLGLLWVCSRVVCKVCKNVVRHKMLMLLAIQKSQNWINLDRLWSWIELAFGWKPTLPCLKQFLAITRGFYSSLPVAAAQFVSSGAGLQNMHGAIAELLPWALFCLSITWLGWVMAPFIEDRHYYRRGSLSLDCPSAFLKA